MTTDPMKFAVEVMLDSQAFHAAQEMKIIRDCTLLAMRAAKYGLSSLTVGERKRLFMFVGFDYATFQEL